MPIVKSIMSVVVAMAGFGVSLSPALAQREAARQPSAIADGAAQKIVGRVTSVDLKRRSFVVEGGGQKAAIPIGEGQSPPTVGERWTITLTITLRPPSASLTFTKD